MDKEFKDRFMEFKEQFFEKERVWIEKNIKEKSLDEAIWDNLKGLVIELVCILCKFMFFHDGLVNLKDGEYSKEERDVLNNTIDYTDLIIKDLDSLLEPFIEVDGQIVWYIAKANSFNERQHKFCLCSFFFFGSYAAAKKKNEPKRKNVAPSTVVPLCSLNSRLLFPNNSRSTLYCSSNMFSTTAFH